jgi:hypothetical protein
MKIVLRRKSLIKIPAIIAVSCSLLFIGVFIFTHSQSTSAIDTSTFNPGKIIDDSVFYNATTMSASDIQTFLNNEVTTCDTQGAQIVSGSETRAQYSATQGYYPPFTCLKDYSTTTNTQTADAYCNGYTAATQTAAQVIYGVAQSCGINPQVLLVLLQKEEGLVTDTWPWSIQYQSATGYGCPDSTPGVCSSSYYGLFNQLYNAARQFKLYAAKSSSYTFKAGQNNTIPYNPSSSCGSSVVDIQNQATAGLYNYTPYQPNTAALAEGAGTGNGDSCSSYGNLNFWTYFNEWFGSTNTIPGCSIATGTTLSCVWKLKNVANNSEVLTTSYSGMLSQLNAGGYEYAGIAFIVRNPVAASATNIPIYSVTIGSSTFITANQNEYASLKSQGYTDDGIAFYADPAGSNTGFPVYRLYSSTYGHVWTESTSEVQAYEAQGYVSEGVAFTTMDPVNQAAAPPVGHFDVYRFNMGNLGHFWTTDINERDQMIQAGYTYEGVAFQSSASTTSTPVYRLYSPAIREHLFTTDQNEVSVLTGSGWNNEGIAFYESGTATSIPVYRLYSLVDYEHLLSTDPHEVSVLVSSGTYRNEGIAFYQP